MSFVSQSLRRFGRDEHGAIALIFALMVVVIIFIVGVSIDTGRAVRASVLALNALDAAALAGAKGMVEDGLDDGEINQRVADYVQAQFQGAGLQDVTWSGLNVATDRAAGAVSVGLDMHVPTTFTRLLAYETIDFRKEVTTKYVIKAVELAMALDVTGSMNDDNKIDDMKDAAKAAIDILLPPGKFTLNRVALAPFSAAVNAAGYAGDVSDNRSADGCVIERDGPVSATDAPAVGVDSLLVEADAPAGSFYRCPDAEIMPLSKNRLALHGAIDGFNPDGATAGHLGVAWAWYLISPSWTGLWPSSSDPKPYGDAKTVKAAIVMTDGMFNTSYFNGPVNKRSDRQALDLCEEMKNAGIKVYTIGFAIANQPPPDDKKSADLLSECASDDGQGGKLFYEAQNGGELMAAFKDIAGKLQALRLAN